MQDKTKASPSRRWAHLRFAVVGLLLAAPPPRGELGHAIRRLAKREWTHPTTGEPTRFAFSTIERWLYAARRERRDPVGVLRRKVRRDSGQHPSMPARMRPALLAQYKAHPTWSYQLHHDNLAALVRLDTELGRLPSYATVRRFMRAHGLLKVKRSRRRSRDTDGTRRAEERLEQREVRSYEATHVHGLWHLDYHLGSLPVLTRAGEWVRPVVLGVLDDCSRLACHVQWYLHETARNLVHAVCQAIQKRALPRALLTDNGSAMVAGETTQGLARLGIVHETILPYSAYQNGKQEVFWAQVEGRLLSMLEGCHELTLPLLNEATQAWVEGEYNRKLHSELGTTPLQRFLDGPDVGRESPDSETLRLAFCLEESRAQRRSDGTLSLEGRRFEVPSRFRHLPRLTVRYARWDLSRVFLVDGSSGTVLERLYPLDKAKNADGQRRRLAPAPLGEAAEEPVQQPTPGIAPHLRALMEEHAATGLPPGFLPQAGDENPTPNEDNR